MFPSEAICQTHIRLNNFYMDNFIQSSSTPAAARQLTKNLRTVLQRGGFCLTKFISNNSDALSAIPAVDCQKSASETKVFGSNMVSSH